MWYKDKRFGKCYSMVDEKVDAVIAPEMGMSLVSFTAGDTQILDVSRTDLFLKYRKGLGPLILPHFNEEGFIPKAKKSAFSHIGYLKNNGVKHPFQHGIGRYVEWKAEASENRITGFIEGSMETNGYTFKELAGFDFKAAVTYTVIEGALEVHFSINGEKPVASGIHYYYNLVNRNTAKLEIPESEGRVRIIDFNRSLNDVLKPISVNSERQDDFFKVLKEKPVKNYSYCTLKTDKYQLQTVFTVNGKPEDVFDSLVVFSPENAGFVCIEPISYIPGEGAVKKINSGTIYLNPLSL